MGERASTRRRRHEGCGALERFLRTAVGGGIQAATLAIGGGEDLDGPARAAGVTLPPSLERAAPGRQREYLAGRICARTALEKRLGPAAAALADLDADADGVPLWPEGIAGSISHGAGMALAAVGGADECGCLGVDVERVVAPERAARLAPRVLNESERRLGRRSGLSSAEWFALTFSAKESVYKALYPVHRRFLGFRDVELVERIPARGDGRHGRLILAVDPADGHAALRQTLIGHYAFTGAVDGADSLAGGAAKRVWTFVVGADGEPERLDRNGDYRRSGDRRRRSLRERISR